MRLPEAGYEFQPDRAGTEQLRALLFTDRAMAQLLIEKLAPPARGAPISEDQFRVKSNKITIAEATPQPYYSSEVQFQVLTTKP